MQRIFNDEASVSGQIWSNLFGTQPISPLDVVAKRWKWLTRRRVPRPASSKMGCADATKLILNGP